MLRGLAVALAVALGSAPTPSVAQPPVLRAPNLAPQHLVHPTPTSDTPSILPEGASALSLDAAYASVFMDHAAPGHGAVRFDLEAARLALRVARGLGRDTEVGAEVPCLWMGPGIFDGFLQAYHRALGLPSGGREDAGANEFTYDLRVGRDRYAPSGGAGLGDASVWVKAALPAWGPVQWAARGAVEPPTGSRRRGLGSGHPDATAGLLWAAEAGPLRLGGSAEGVYLGGTPDDALRLGTHWAAGATLSAGAPLRGATEGIVQLSYFATPYATGLSAVDRDVLTLALGLRSQLSRTVALTFGFTEDLAVGASPDFELFLSVESPLGLPR